MLGTLGYHRMGDTFLWGCRGVGNATLDRDHPVHEPESVSFSVSIWIGRMDGDSADAGHPFGPRLAAMTQSGWTRRPGQAVGRKTSESPPHLIGGTRRISRCEGSLDGAWAGA
jgi:hypothetical protein